MPNRIITGLSAAQVRQLQRRCVQTIEQIIADVEKMPGTTTVLQTQDGPLVHRATGSNILGVAHMDFVGVPYRFDVDVKARRIYTPRLDDRLGVFILLDLLPSFGVNLDLLLTDSEELGRSTASEFTPKSHDYNWMVEFDRRGDGVVMYDYEYDDTWKDAIANHGFDVQFGSFSDISTLTGLGVCGMNVGVGYHHEHSSQCYMELSQLLKNLRLFFSFYDTHKDTRFAFDESEMRKARSAKYNSVRYYGSYYDNYGSRHDWSYYGRFECECCGQTGVCQSGYTYCDLCLTEECNQEAYSDKLLSSGKVDEYWQFAEDVDNGDYAIPTKISQELSWMALIRGDRVFAHEAEGGVDYFTLHKGRWYKLYWISEDMAKSFLRHTIDKFEGVVRLSPENWSGAVNRGVVGDLVVRKAKRVQCPDSGIIADGGKGFMQSIHYQLLDPMVPIRRVGRTIFEAYQYGGWYNVVWNSKTNRQECLRWLRHRAKVCADAGIVKGGDIQPPWNSARIRIFRDHLDTRHQCTIHYTDPYGKGEHCKGIWSGDSVHHNVEYLRANGVKDIQLEWHDHTNKLFWVVS